MIEAWEQCIDAVSIHHLTTQNKNNHEHIGSLRRLLDKNNLNSIEIWKILSRQNAMKSADGSINQNAAQEYINTSYYILRSWPYYPRQTQKEHEKTMLLVAQKAQELKDLLVSPSSSDRSKRVGNRWTPAYMLLGLGNKIVLRGMFQNSNMEDVDRILSCARRRRHRLESEKMSAAMEDWASAYTGECDERDNCTDISEALEKIEMPNDEDWVLSKLWGADILDILDYIAHSSTEISKINLPLKKPNADNAKATFFLRKMHQYHMQVFGTPLWEALSLSANICLDLPTPLDASAIRPLFRD